VSLSADKEATSLKQLLGAADHIDRLLSAKSAEQAVELAAELLLATSGAAGVVVFAKGVDGLEEQWAAGQLEGGEDRRKKLAASVLEEGNICVEDSMCAIPLSAGRVYAVLVAQGAPELTEELAVLLTSLGSRGLEAAALRVAATKQQQLRLSLNRYLNPSLIRTIVRGDHSASTTPTIRSVSILRLDVEGFSKQVDMIGPDRLLPVMNQFFAIVADTVYEHEGAILQHDLDGVMAVFGAPIKIDDTTAADLASAAGLLLIDRLQDLAERWGVEGLPIHIETRAGVASGPVLVGSFGHVDRPLLAAFGPYATLAKKLAIQGEVAELVVDSSTRTLLAERLSTRSIGAVEVRGLDYPIFAYSAQRSIK
jgi:class 3 adenylate cyclase